MTASLSTTNDVWDTAAGATFRWHGIADEEVEAYAQLLSRLKREIGDLASTSAWEDALRLFRFGLFAFAGTPLPFAHEALGLRQLEGELRRFVPSLAASAPQFSAGLEALVDRFEAIAGSVRDPLGDRVRQLLTGSDGATCIILRWPRRVEAVSNVLGGIRVQVASAGQLREIDLFQNILAIGPSMWFPSLLSAPRANVIEIVHLRVMKDAPSIPAVFLASKSRGSTLHRRPATRDEKEPVSDPRLAEIDQDLFRPRVEWAAIDRAGQGWHAGGEYAFDQVQARLLLLADGFACYLECEQGSRSTILDLKSLPDDRVRQVDWRGVSLGMVLILRTEGGDDVSHLADVTMGPRAQTLRERQRSWKTELRRQVSLHGSAQVADTLRRLGSPIASPQNVQSWSSMRTIKTRDRADFDAIMQLTGQADQAGSAWEDMRLIHKAHLRAGVDRVAKLKDRIEHADLSTVMTIGRADFEVPALGSGTLTAFRVEDISMETFTVSPHQVDRPFQVDEALWHG